VGSYALAEQVPFSADSNAINVLVKNSKRSQTTGLTQHTHTHTHTHTLARDPIHDPVTVRRVSREHPVLILLPDRRQFAACTSEPQLRW